MLDRSRLAGSCWASNISSRAGNGRAMVFMSG
jgi:hypothetical protein